MTQKQEYECRLLFWADILGFSELVKQTSEADTIRKVYDVFEAAEKSLSKAKLTIMKVDLSQWRFHILSDTMIVSCPHVSHDDLNILFFVVASFQANMFARHDLFVRGSLVSGKLYDKEQSIIFGPAAVLAHELESAKAVWPRILVDDSIIALANIGDAIDLLKIDVHGNFFVDYLNDLFHMLSEASDPRGVVSGVDLPVHIFKEHKAAIERCVTEAKANASLSREVKRGVLEKYHALTAYHNTVVDEHLVAIDQVIKNPSLISEIASDSNNFTDTTLVNPSQFWVLASTLRRDLVLKPSTGYNASLQPQALSVLNRLDQELTQYRIDTAQFKP